MAVVGSLFSLLGATSLGALTISTGSIWATAGLRLLGSVALSALSQALAPKPKPAGLRSETTLSGGVQPETFILGRFATSGVFVAPPMSHGAIGKTPNGYLTYVIELAGVPGHALAGLYLDGEAVEISDASPHADYGKRITGRFTDRAWIKFYDGTQTTADSMLVAKYPAPYVRPWSSAMVGAGVCYAILTFRFDQKVFQGFPQARFVLDGPALLDPRTGTTARTSNAALLLWHVMRGITLPSGDVWGGGIATGDLPAAVWEAAMDACDDLADDEPRYRAGFEVSVADEPFSVVEELLKACSGRLTDTGGTWLLQVGAPALPALFITDDDIIADEAEDYAPFPPPDQVYNAISAKFPDPSSQYGDVETPLRTNEDWEAEDGDRRLTVGLTLPAVPYPLQARRLIGELIADHRRMIRHTLTLPPMASALTPGDVIGWNSARNGYDAKTFEVTEAIRDLRTQLVRVSLREVDPDDWSPVIITTLPSPPSTLPGIAEAQAVVSFAAAPWELTVAGEPRRSGIACTWAADGADDARGVRLAVRQSGATDDGREYPLVAVATGVATLSDGLLPGDWQVRARYEMDRASAWTSWVTVTVPDVRLSLDDVSDDLVEWLGTMRDWIDGGVTDLPADLLALSTDLVALTDALAVEIEQRGVETAQAADRWRVLAERVRTLTAEVMDLGADAYLQRAEIRRELSLSIDGVAADFAEQITLLVGEQTATAARVTTLEASTEDLEAEVAAVDLARVNGDEALAGLIAEISVGSAVQFDHAEIWYFDTTVEGWTGDPSAPTIAATGYLRPAAASYVASPTGLAVSATAYAQVRARVRRVGTPTWSGQLWWAATGQGWDAGRRETLAAPDWVDNVALLTWAPGWTGTIDRIRVDLADGADGSNYIEIDWIAIGRPAPGATSAELIAERAARIAGDEASATDIAALDARLTDAEGQGDANASAIDGLETRVGETENGLTAAVESIEALEATVNDPATGVVATAEAVDLVTGRVDALDDGSQVVQSEAIRTLRSILRRTSAESADALAGAYLGRKGVRDALALAEQTLNTRIDATDEDVVILAEAITALQAAIPGLATADALSALTALVTEQGGTITSQGTAITSLTSRITAAEGVNTSQATAITSLDTRVTAAEGVNTSQATAITSLTSRMTSAEDVNTSQATAISSLSTRVTAAEGVNTTQAAAITSLDTRLTAAEGTNTSQATAISGLDTRLTAAEGVNTSQASSITSLNSRITAAEGVNTTQATAISTLDTRVTAAEGVNTAQADALTALTATVDGVSASATFRMATQTGPSGYARIGMEARVDDEDTFRAAGLYIDTPTNPALPSRVAIMADQFAVVGGGGVIGTPFVISGGQVFIADAMIPNASITTAKIADAQITNAKIGGDIQSTNYAESGGVPTAGWKLDRATGTIRGVNFIDRDGLLEGASFDRVEDLIAGLATNPTLDDNYHTALSIYLGPTTISEMWVVHCSLFMRQPQAPDTGESRVILDRRVKFDGAWTDYVGVSSAKASLSGNWTHFNYSDVFGGALEDIEYRLRWRGQVNDIKSPPGTTWPMFRDLSLIAERKIR